MNDENILMKEDPRPRELKRKLAMGFSNTVSFRNKKAFEFDGEDAMISNDEEHHENVGLNARETAILRSIWSRVNEMRETDSEDGMISHDEGEEDKHTNHFTPGKIATNLLKYILALHY